MRRQFSNSAVISTGQPTRVKMKETSWSLSGPPRTLTRSALRLTKRGTGRPLVAASLPACVGATADANVSSAAKTARSQAIISLPCRNVAAACPDTSSVTQSGREFPARFVRAQPIW